MNKRAWIIFGVICIAVLGGLIAYSKRNQVSVGDVDQNTIVKASASNGNIADHVFGNTSGKTVLVEYGDFQCPYCGTAYPTIKDLTEKYKDDLTFVFRNYPLTSLHANARASAAAAEAAGLQGKYWEMHNKLYETQSEWSEAATDQRTSYFVTYAQAIGVTNIDKFKSDMDSNTVNSKINFDLALGNKVPVTGTPTLLINGKDIDSATWGDKTKFEDKIKEALKG